MKIAVVLPGQSPQQGGGYTFERALIEALSRLESGHEFRYWSTGDLPAEGSVRIPSSYPSAAARRLREMARDVEDRWVGARPVPARSWLDRSFEREGVDLVWFATNFALDTDLPFIFTVWDLEYLQQPWFPEVSRGGEWERREHYYRRFLPRATRVIVPSVTATERLLAPFGVYRDRLLELHHPAPELQAPDDETCTRLLEAAHVREPYVFYPAQFWPHKNHAVLLDALAGLPPELTLVLTGSDKGSLDHVKRTAERLGLSERVKFLGFVDDVTLAALYRRAVALVYPSFFGPENMPPLEAFVLGCPVVAADVPGAREQMGDGAILVDPLDGAGFAAAIEQLRADPAVSERLVAAGRAQAQAASAARYVEGVAGFLDEFEQIRRCWP